MRTARRPHPSCLRFLRRKSEPVKKNRGLVMKAYGVTHVVDLASTVIHSPELVRGNRR